MTTRPDSTLQKGNQRKNKYGEIALGRQNGRHISYKANVIFTSLRGFREFQNNVWLSEAHVIISITNAYPSQASCCGYIKVLILIECYTYCEIGKFALTGNFACAGCQHASDFSANVSFTRERFTHNTILKLSIINRRVLATITLLKGTYHNCVCVCVCVCV